MGNDTREPPTPGPLPPNTTHLVPKPSSAIPGRGTQEERGAAWGLFPGGNPFRGGIPRLLGPPPFGGPPPLSGDTQPAGWRRGAAACWGSPRALPAPRSPRRSRPERPAPPTRVRAPRAPTRRAAAGAPMGGPGEAGGAADWLRPVHILGGGRGRAWRRRRRPRSAAGPGWPLPAGGSAPWGGGAGPGGAETEQEGTGQDGTENPGAWGKPSGARSIPGGRPELGMRMMSRLSGC